MDFLRNSPQTLIKLCLEKQDNTPVFNENSTCYSTVEVLLYAASAQSDNKAKSELLNALTHVVSVNGEGEQFNPSLAMSGGRITPYLSLARSLPNHAVISSDLDDIVANIIKNWMSRFGFNEIAGPASNPIYVLFRSGNYNAANNLFEMGFSADKEIVSKYVANSIPTCNEKTRDGVIACVNSLVKTYDLGILDPITKYNNISVMDRCFDEKYNDLHSFFMTAIMKERMDEITKAREKLGIEQVEAIGRLKANRHI